MSVSQVTGYRGQGTRSRTKFLVRRVAGLWHHASSGACKCNWEKVKGTEFIFHPLPLTLSGAPDPSAYSLSPVTYNLVPDTWHLTPYNVGDGL